MLALLLLQAFFGAPGVAEWHPSTAAVEPVLTFGDSKTSSGRYQMFAFQQLEFAHPTRFDVLAHGGYSVATWRPLIDAEIAGVSETGYTFILFNLGANDVVTLPDQATWESNAGYLLDALHTRWPAAKVLVMRIWQADKPTDADTLDGWVGNIVAARSAWAFLGPDERVFLRRSDNGAAYCPDGTHPNYLGYIETANQWLASMRARGFSG